MGASAELVLTRNFYNYLRGVAFGSQDSFNGPVSGKGRDTRSSSDGWRMSACFPVLINDKGEEDTSGIATELSPEDAAFHGVSICKARTETDRVGMVIGLGTGTKEPTYTDYTIESPILNRVFPDAVMCEYSGVTARVTYSVLFRNSGSSQVSITECGLYYKATGYAIVQSWRKEHYYLFARGLFDQPVVVEAGGTRNINISISF